jgi:hypothetical protein
MRPLSPLVRRTILICTVAVLLGVGAGLVGLYWLAKSFGGPEVTTDVAAYGTMLKEWSSSGLVAHFPANVPPQARAVRFAAYPGFLQGGAYIQLRMQLPAGEIEAIEDRLKKATTHVYTGGGFFDHDNEDQKNNWPTTTFHTSDNPKTTFDFPRHYKLYVLSAKNLGGSWNHGETSGVAVSKTGNEVVYWADSW